MEKQVVILFGAPGAGKGTQAELLSDKLGLYYFETSRILEREFKKVNETSKDRYVDIEGRKFDVLEGKKQWETGMLVDPPYVTQLVIQEITKLCEEGESLVLSGSPRTIYEVERVMPTLEKLYGKKNIKIVLIEISAAQTIFRNSHRKICELMRHGMVYNEETEKLTKCPLDGSVLLKRKGLDDPETIKVRIKEYTGRTLPMLEYFKNNKFKVDKINGEQTPAEVFGNILKIVQ